MHDVALAPDGVPIHFDVNGDIDGDMDGQDLPALLFVHGWCCHRGHWHKQVEHFAKRHAVITIDLGGHGESGRQREEWTMTAFGEDVAAVVNQMDLGKVVLVGHSMGGTVIVEATQLLPDRVIGLVGVDTFRTLGLTRTQEASDAALEPLRHNFKQACDEFVRSQMFIPASAPHLVEAVVDEMAAAPAEVALAAGEALFLNDAALRRGIESISAPIVAINADYHATDMDAARRLGVEVKLMSGVGHFVMLEDAPTFNRLLEETIQQFVAATPATQSPHTGD